VDEKKAEEMQAKFERNQFTLEDFRDSLGQVKKLGSLQSVMSLLPGDMFKGMPKLTPEMTTQMEKQLKRTEAIIDSMTPAERNNHLIINMSRRKRIAHGSGTTVNEVNQMLQEYAQMKQMMKAMMGGGGMFGGLGGKVAKKLTGIGGKKKERIKVKKKKRR
jgi:signal recognition particle subunit SRP54